MAEQILTLNAGSSSIKFALFAIDDDPSAETHLDELARGQIEGLGAAAHLRAKDSGGEELARRDYTAAEMADHEAALGAVLDLLGSEFQDVQVAAVGHRVVHGGMDFAEPMVAGTEVMQALEKLVPLAPLHQPHNLTGIRAAHTCFPAATQVACFDTAFHRRHPWVNDTFALPRDLYDEGIRRYGFHGLSYEYIAEEMAKRAPEQAAGRMVAAHLGNGASLCAIRNGQSVCSTMGFTALDGLPMGTRCGQLDPGVVLYLMNEKGMDYDAISDLLYGRSGLMGLSGVSNDMRELETSGAAAAEQAIEYFVNRVRREIGALAATVGGLDALVFCGGIGEGSARIRADVAAGFDWLGLKLDAGRNGEAAPVISADGSAVKVYVVPTDEEAMIARHTWRLIADPITPTI